MEKNYAIGLMSGTSLDGLDICYSNFSKNVDDKWDFEILEAETVPYSADWEDKLRNSIHFSAEDLYALNAEYGFYLGEKLNEFIRKNQIKNLDVIASHGHTVFHQPHRHFTVQIGDGRAIKIHNEYPVVYDFRSADVLLGGNGAPLVPIGDRLLFSEFGACLNLGGFSNISAEIGGNRIAFDICPVNIVINYFAENLGRKFDENGAIAKSGNVDRSALQQLNELPFYKQDGPKSLGIEWVKKEVFPLLEILSPETAIATFTEHAALKISEEITELNVPNVLVTGGGAYNTFLLERIAANCPAELIVPNSKTVDYKEALIFAFMGMLRLKNLPNVLSSATGSSSDHCTGLLV